MSTDISLAEAEIRRELKAIQLTVSRLSVNSLDARSETLSVEIVAEEFEGQTYLDREMRVRPAVSRGLARAGLPRAEYLIHALAPIEEMEADPARVGNGEADVEDGTEDISIRKRWRNLCTSVREALIGDGYGIEPIADDIFLASRGQLAAQTILVVTAKNPSSSTVDLDLRRAAERSWSARHPTACYYLTARKLEAAFSNQAKPHWVTVSTAVEFLHLLNRSDELSRSLVSYLRSYRGQSVSATTPTIDPTIRVDGRLHGETYYQYAEGWLSNTDRSEFQILMAPAGHGKTTICTDLALKLAEKFALNKTGPLPLFVPFEAVRRTVDFEALLLKQLNTLRFGSYSAFRELLKAGEAVLIVDGFDELADDAGLEVAESQVRSMRGLVGGMSKVILAGRSLFTEHVFGTNVEAISARIHNLLGNTESVVVDIQRFDRDQIKRYIRERIDLLPKLKSNITSGILGDQDTVDLFGNPLLLRLYCDTFSGDDADVQSALRADFSEGTSSLNQLIVRVCEREEHRQNLGIGSENQLGFLGELAIDMYRRNTPHLPAADIRIAGELHVAPRTPLRDTVIGRLMSHALLSSSRGNVSFVHPLVRDAIMTQVLVSPQFLGATPTKQFEDLLAIRDLPENVVTGLARQESSVRSILAMPGWLWNPRVAPANTRRNLARVAFRTVDPRTGVWLRDEWISAPELSGLDLSQLVLEGLEFRKLKFDSCNLNGALFIDCQFEDVGFWNCAMHSTRFIDCSAFGGLAVNASEFVDVSVVSDDTSATVQDSTQLAEEIKKGTGAPTSRTASTAALARAEVLFSAVLYKMFKPGPPQRFVETTEEQMKRVAGPSRGERKAIDLIVNSIVSRICRVRMSGDSKEKLEIDIRWKRSTFLLLMADRRTPEIAQIMAESCRRAAKHLG